MYFFHVQMFAFAVLIMPMDMCDTFSTVLEKDLSLNLD